MFKDYIVFCAFRVDLLGSKNRNTETSSSQKLCKKRLSAVMNLTL